jgi:hypothetical protein
MAYMVVREDGPANMFGRIRYRFAWTGALQCVYCMSVWTAGVAYLLWLTPLQPLVWIAAISGAALMLASWTGVHHATI